jgi:hypothetical protein
MGRPRPDVARALGKVAIGIALSGKERERRLTPLRMGNMAQLVQVPIEGRAAATPTHTEKVRVAWPYPIINGQSRTDSNLDFPHWHASPEILEPLEPALFLHPAVVGWERNQEEWFTAAFVRVSVWLPDSPPPATPIPFTAVLHCTFTGYAAPTEDEELYV